MIVSYEHQFIFIKSRKTAGSTLEKLLTPYLGEKDVCSGSERDGTPAKNMELNGNGHLGWRGIAIHYTDVFNPFWKFTIERNPWDKVVSSYFWHKNIKPHIYGDMPFETYVSEKNSLLPRDWLEYSNEDGLVVDKVFKYEEMWEMYEYLNDKFKLDIKQDQVYNTQCKSGIRKVQDYRELHTNKTIETVAKLFENEIREFGYTYDG